MSTELFKLSLFVSKMGWHNWLIFKYSAARITLGSEDLGKTMVFKFFDAFSLNLDDVHFKLLTK